MADKIKYVCQTCGAEGVKLWRRYNAFLNGADFICATCLNEKYPDEDEPPIQFGIENSAEWYVRCVLNEDQTVCWGMSSTPQEDYIRWLALPLTQDNPEKWLGRTRINVCSEQTTKILGAENYDVNFYAYSKYEMKGLLNAIFPHEGVFIKDIPWRH